METEFKPEPGAARRSGGGFLTVVTLSAALLGGVVLDRFVLFTTAKAGLDVALVTEAWKKVRRNYVDRAALKPREVTYGAIEGMVDALGDTGHSTFLSPTMVKQLKDETKGELKGIGVEIQNKAGHVVVVAPMDGSPAQKAGLRPGDIFLKVFGEEITGWPLSRVVDKITGMPGTPVTLTVLDPRTGRTREMTITRAALKIQSLTWNQLPGTSFTHLRVASFDEGVTKNLRRALTEIERTGSTAIVLDLRNNPGGILDEAVGVASQFLNGGNVLLSQDAQGKVTPVPVVKGGLAPTMPLVVLINGGSASGAEIVAGALKDASRGPLVGETTFGTGTVLSEFPLSDGSALLLAIEEWLTPKGQSFWHKGITPMIPITMPDDAIPLAPEGERKLTAAELQASGDRQLLRAIEFLNTKR